VVQIHSPRPNFPSRIIILCGELCFTCALFCVPGSHFFKSLAGDHSFSSEFTALRCEIHFTASLVLEKLGTGSRFWEKNQEPKFCAFPTSSRCLRCLLQAVPFPRTPG